ncbi:hypothetical protein IM792_15455 [Mucilaginibacter sp. JRF]|uniref:hypothetical protein n=1 Tax=Mucilaginibacter sp. JRF TaxID=2780088 RepID=UPI00187ED3EB|nr:hypothetical protein [Mucilaginibacter sp. JRF]MBE9585852.1 hypothetical protein [Mucilaginibacter sp. JRF]
MQRSKQHIINRAKNAINYLANDNEWINKSIVSLPILINDGIAITAHIVRFSIISNGEQKEWQATHLDGAAIAIQ